MERVTLENGLKVGNFSSPHSFQFNTGETLPGVPGDESKRLSIRREEKVVESGDSRFRNVEISFRMTREVAAALIAAEKEDVDIIIVPLPIKSAMEQEGIWEGTEGKLRTCVLSDRVSKTVDSSLFGV